mmetsp:Transcript_45065/g.111934  ORF Transcript_45065/g.111934 Transcript_45065/m.111934 type:complete len:189 (+) Transcript_45065:470-1036(+)
MRLGQTEAGDMRATRIGLGNENIGSNFDGYSFRAQLKCWCNGLDVRRRVSAGALEVHSLDSEQPSASIAEWDDHNRSAAYAAFRQLNVRTDGDTLGLVAAEVQELFPRAVSSLEAGALGAETEAGEIATIDLTQLVYTQMGVIQDLMKTMESVLGRVGRLEGGPSGEQEASHGPIEAIQKAMEGLMAP